MKKMKAPAFDRPATIIGENTDLSASLLKCSESLKIIGKYTGDIESSSSVVVSETGCVIGNIKAEFAYICGVVEGNIEVSQTIQIAHSGNVSGSVVCANIITDEGAVLNGSCTMRQLDANAFEYLD
ncbi:MAG: polymer-forming cytoskeletal protein [Lachnospiraceae bacterium]|nr:polymer-forming cytoskeletal protein [Lachnospiraceae bacterium]